MNGRRAKAIRKHLASMRVHTGALDEYRQVKHNYSSAPKPSRRVFNQIMDRIDNELARVKRKEQHDRK